MTRKEFIQKWVCDNINNGATANELIAFAVAKADEIEKCDPSFFDDSFKIAKLYQELDTIPINAITFSKGQFKTRFVGACYVAQIKTIGDLVRYGYSRFLQLRNIGRDTIREVEDFIRCNYNINWS